MNPGAMALQRTPCLPYWVATYCVRLMRAAFEAPYAGLRRSPARPDPDEVLMMEPPPRRDHVRDGGLDGDHGPAQVDAHRVVPDRRVGLQDGEVLAGGQVGGRRVVVQDVETAVRLDRRGHHGPYALHVAQVDRDRRRGAAGGADLLRHRLGAVEVQVGDHRVRALGRQAAGGGRADAGRGPGDDGDLVFEPSHGRTTFSSCR